MSKFILIIVLISVVCLYIYFSRWNIKCYSAPEITTNNYTPYPPIDVVYTWVNGNDEEWLDDKNKYQSESVSNSENGNGDNRWRDYNTLKYSLYSVYTYAGWVRNVYIVTSHQQVPSWLHDIFPEVKVIDHTEIIPSSALPTFQSLSIEACIHRIPNLSEYYLYFNDDVLLGNYIHPSDFFDDSLRRKVFLDNRNILSSFFQSICESIFETTLTYTNSVLNTIKTENIPRNWCLHTPHLRSVSQDKMKWKEFPKEYNKTVHSKFRADENIHDVSIFDAHWALYKGYAVKGEISHVFVSIRDDVDELKENLEKVEKIRPKTFVLNDDTSNFNKDAYDTIDNFLTSFFKLK